MKAAVIYAWYSSTNQTEQSIEGQVYVFQDYTKRNDIIIVDSYIDRAISGTTDEKESLLEGMNQYFIEFSKIIQVAKQFYKYLKILKKKILQIKVKSLYHKH